MDEFDEKMNNIPEEENTAVPEESAETAPQSDFEVKNEVPEEKDSFVFEGEPEKKDSDYIDLSDDFSKEEEPKKEEPPFVPPFAPMNGHGEPMMPPPPEPQFNSSGEYRFVPPKAPNPPFGAPTGANGYADNRGPMQPPLYQPAPPKPDKKKKEKKAKLSVGAVAVIVVICVLVSFAAGVGGALLVNQNVLGLKESTGNNMVIYKTADDDDDDDTPTVSEDDLSVEDVCAKVSASVVEIDTEFKNSYGFYQYVSDGAGSGVIVSADGYVVTNNHVIYNSDSNKVADSITVRLSDGTEYKATLVGRDSDADIALLKVEAKKLQAAVMGSSSKLCVGQSVIAVGNPLGELGGTVTCGIISATNREISVENNKMNLIQIDAAINPGNSGGGLFNLKGELIGVVNAKSTGSDIDGLGFAIPVDDALTVIEEIQTHGYVTGKTYIGIAMADVTDVYTAYYYFKSQQTGVFITQVEEGYNDDVLKYGDRIVAIDGEEISSSEDVKSAIKDKKVGDKLKFSISREGKFTEVTVTLYEYVPDNDISFSDN